MRNALLFIGTALVGAVAIALVVWNTGSPAAFRAWYWLAAIPALCIVSAVLGYWIPRHAWRWGMAPLLGQWLWEILASGTQIGTGSLGPFAHVVVFVGYALTAVLCIVAAEIAAFLSRRAARVER
jgi:hypothetical protein